MSNTQVQNLIIGHLGQDGRLLRDMLSAKGESWFGMDRHLAGSSVTDRSPCATDIGVFDNVRELFRRLNPGRVFYLAAVHHSATQAIEISVFEQYTQEIMVNSTGVLNCLEAIRTTSMHSRFVFASSSLVFAPTPHADILLNENSLKAPMETYAMEKLFAGKMCADFRQQYNVHASVAFLFNHESPYRPSGFFTHHVLSSIKRILEGKADYVEVGDLQTVVDWSYAGDVVRALLAIADGEQPQDFVVASGAGHTIEEFLAIAFSIAGLDMGKHIRVNPSRMVRLSGCRIGDPTKLQNATGWRPQLTFKEMVTHLTETALMTQTGLSDGEKTGTSA